MTKSQLISDIILRITKGKPSDDLELEPRQVAFWLTLVRDALVKEYLDRKGEAGLQPDDFFVKKEAYKQLLVEQYPDIDDENERMYINLSCSPLEIYGDRGVVRVATSEGSWVKKAKLSTIDFIKNMEFSAPSVKNLVYYRDGQKKVIIDGVPQSMKDSVSIYVWYVPRIDIEQLDDDDDVIIPNELIGIVQDEVEKIARRQMFGFADTENDGKDGLPNAEIDG